MGIIELIPWILLAIGALRSVGRAKSSGRSLSGTSLTALWILSITVPLICQMLMVAVFSPGLRVTALHWFLIDNFGLRLGSAGYIVDAFWRSVGVIVGIVIVNTLAANTRLGGSYPAAPDLQPANAGSVKREPANTVDQAAPGDRGALEE
jgi:hypothetical protein